MGMFARFTDGLANIASGLGMAIDRRSGSFYSLSLLDAAQIDAAYRSSWLVRKIVDVPALDMTRERRDWQAAQADIARLEAEEKRLQLWAKLRQALILGRLGGGAIVMGVGNEDPATPIDRARLRPGCLRYLHVVSRHRLGLGPIVRNPTSPLFGQPEYFQLLGADGEVRIHPSRVVVFCGLPVPDLGVAMNAQSFWGDSIVQSIEEAVKNADAATGGFAGLIHESKVDTVSIPGLLDLVATAEGETRLKQRVEIANTLKSIWHTRIIEGGNGDAGSAEQWETRQINWAGVPEVMNAFMGFVAGAADIPATRLLGRAPQGLNATGEGDLTNYYDGIAARQDSDLRPQIEQIDGVLVSSAGVDDPGLWFAFPPLTTPTEKEAAETFRTAAQAIETLQTTGLIPAAAMARATQNLLAERGYLPGLDAALAEGAEDEERVEPRKDGNDRA